MSKSLVDDDCSTHLFSYRHAGAEWTLEIRAADAADAKARLSALALARYDGRLVAKLPIGLGPVGKIFVALRNAFQS